MREKFALVCWLAVSVVGAGACVAEDSQPDGVGRLDSDVLDDDTPLDGIRVDLTCGSSEEWASQPKLCPLVADDEEEGKGEPVHVPSSVSRYVATANNLSQNLEQCVAWFKRNAVSEALEQAAADSRGGGAQPWWCSHDCPKGQVGCMEYTGTVNVGLAHLVGEPDCYFSPHDPTPGAVNIACQCSGTVEIARCDWEGWQVPKVQIGCTGCVPKAVAPGGDAPVVDEP